MSYRVRYTKSARDDLLRLFAFLLEHDLHAAARAREAIAKGMSIYLMAAIGLGFGLSVEEHLEEPSGERPAEGDARVAVEHHRSDMIEPVGQVRDGPREQAPVGCIIRELLHRHREQRRGVDGPALEAARQAVADFDLFQEKRMHLILVRDDLDFGCGARCPPGNHYRPGKAVRKEPAAILDGADSLSADYCKQYITLSPFPGNRRVGTHLAD